jgi:peptide/nickel transport system substrate-binding protein
VGRFNQEVLHTKIIAVDKVALESFKKGDLDVLMFTPEQWVRETGDERFGLGPGSGKPLVKLDVQNRAPRPYRYVGWNLGSPLFSDRRVRRAMAHLFDRDTFIEKFYHGLQVKAVGPFEVDSPYSSPRVEPIGFSVPEAIGLLREAGWRDSDGDGVLERDGRPFSFTLMTADPETSVKMLTLTKETMRKAGVEMNLRVVDWSTLLALIDEYRFDAVMLGWTRSPWPDPTPLWHSASAVQGGLNLVRYRNPEVDRLIERGVRSIPEPERVGIFRRIHELIYADQPYTFLTERNHVLVGYRAAFRFVKPWYSYDLGLDYWWLDQAIR